MITDRIGLHSVLLPLLMATQIFATIVNENNLVAHSTKLEVLSKSNKRES